MMRLSSARKSSFVMALSTCAARRATSLALFQVRGRAVAIPEAELLARQGWLHAFGLRLRERVALKQGDHLG